MKTEKDNFIDWQNKHTKNSWYTMRRYATIIERNIPWDLQNILKLKVPSLYEITDAKKLQKIYDKWYSIKEIADENKKTHAQNSSAFNMYINYRKEVHRTIPKRHTVQIANSDLLNGEKFSQEKARITLPYLVRQAKAGQTIYYSDLADEVGISNPRNLNRVLGFIGNALIKLEKRAKMKIPPLQCVVINKRQGLPGEGIGWFISPTDFSKLNKTQKQIVVSSQLTKIYTFQRWDWVLQQFGLAPVPTDLDDELEKAKNKRGGGESEQHKKFKEFISKNPSVLGLSGNLKSGEQEYTLPSCDTVDVLFTDKGLKIGVEVKSSISDTADILRGLFQCVKYKHLIEAEQTVNDEIPNSRVFLALQGQLPEELTLVRNLLGIEVIDRIKTSH